jgi:hypothetical protein
MAAIWAIGALIAAYGSFSMHSRAKRRHREVLGWSIAVGKITRFTTSSYGRTVPFMDYSYQVNGRTYKGSATGLPISDDRINEIGDAIDSLPTVRVRYDPAQLNASRILNADNPGIPFKIDQLATH